MDETTYDPGGNAMGYDHPISWCKPYDGGRAWVTGMGHFGAHYTGARPSCSTSSAASSGRPACEAGDCGGTIDWKFEKVALDENTSAPFALDVAPDGRVFFTELVRGQIRVYDPETQNVKTAHAQRVLGRRGRPAGHRARPELRHNGWVYVYHSPDSANNSDPANFKSRVSRFTVDANDDIDPASEKLIIEVPARASRTSPATPAAAWTSTSRATCCSASATTSTRTRSRRAATRRSPSARTACDARETSANTNDLRGKLLRIKPKADGGY